ncbi:MAG: alpha/beta hydrolase-fold protein [Verrucomicrobiota bacterium]
MTTRLLLALALALPAPFALAAGGNAARGGAGPAALPTIDNLKTALTLTDAQVAQITPLLDADAKAQQGVAPLQTAATQARTDAQTKISAVLTEAQRPLLAQVFAPAAARGAGGGGGNPGPQAGTVSPLPDAVEVEFAPPLDKEQGNFKHKPKTTWADVPAIEVKEGIPRGKLIAFSAPPTLAAAAAPAVAPAAAPVAAPDDAAAGGRGARGGRGGGAGGGRACWVYIPAGYKEGDVLPFMVDHDGGANAVVQTQLIAAMDILIAEKKIPMMGAVFIAPVSRSQEYDTVSGVYADYIEKIVFPLAEKTGSVKLSQDPNARGSIGQSSGAPAALGMAWFHEPAFTRLIIYSPSVVPIQRSAAYSTGAQAYPDTLIPNSPKKPLRIWMQVGSNDLNNQYGSWPQHNNDMANALKAKGYEYQFIWSEGAGHVERGVERQTMLEAVEWVWKTYKAK